MATDAGSLARRYFEDLCNRRQMEAASEIVATIYVEHAPAPFSDSEPGAVDGPASTRATVGWLLAQFPDLHFEVEAVVAADDMVAVRVLATGINRGPIGPVPATDRQFSARSSHWFRVADGQLAEHWATRDDLTAMLQLGIVVPPFR